jgi:hypothetical protein
MRYIIILLLFIHACGTDDSTSDSVDQNEPIKSNQIPKQIDYEKSLSLINNCLVPQGCIEFSGSRNDINNFFCSTTKEGFCKNKANFVCLWEYQRGGSIKYFFYKQEKESAVIFENCNIVIDGVKGILYSIR